MAQVKETKMSSELLVALVLSLVALVTLPPAAQAQATCNNFDFDETTRTFEEAMVDPEAISLEHYLNGFRQSLKFLRSFGSLCSLAISELEEKLEVLEGYRNAEERQGGISAYLTIQSAVEYEKEHNLLRDRNRRSGARTILWLNRALNLMSAIMNNLSRLSYDKGTSSAVKEAYGDTLAKHHPWATRMVASVAMNLLPRKRTVVEGLFGEQCSRNEALVNEKLHLLANVSGRLFRIVDKLYDANNIQDLC